MQAVLQRDTTPELLLRRALHSAGLRFRKDCRPEQDLRCKSDIVFPTHRVCVFVDGCFWHRCPLHFALPKTNSAWWNEKVQATVDRDLKQMRALKARGWQVIRVWEHEIIEGHVERIVARVLKRIQAATKAGRRKD
ncbi:MAG: very short patch repair endonuclease [Planctomycetes bacterium]|nr:very short patch repair endonuclease [Planctomycetota bacterium]